MKRDPTPYHSAMAPYQALHPQGSRVRVAARVDLESFRAMWRSHHNLTEAQLAFADEPSFVRNINYYHGGDVLYELDGIPGIWHECCLRAVDA